MKKVGIKMSLYMGLAMSFCLSLTGLLSAGKFTVPAFIINFLVSFVISMVIGLIVPMKPLTDRLCRGMAPGFGRRCLEALISNTIYTPIMTFVMVTIAYKQATAHGAKIPYPAMLIKALVISYVVGFILIFIIQPLFMKLAMKGADIPGRGEDEQ